MKIRQMVAGLLLYSMTLILSRRNFANSPQTATVGNTAVAVSQSVVSSYFWIRVPNIRHET
jgi:hypothetical protein